MFVAGRAIGDPAAVVLGPDVSPEAVATLRGNLGLDDPLLTQYGRFVAGALRLDFGTSYWQGVPAMSLVLQRLPATAFLALCAFFVAIPTGVVIGAVAARRPGSIIDRATNVLSLAGASVVEFWVALMLIFLVAIRIDWVPTSGFGGVGVAGLSFVLLPALTLAIRPLGRVAQVSRGALIEELSKPYVKMARAKGISERRVVGRHGLKNALIPIITLSGDELTSMMNGVIILEVIFAWPGVGQLLVQAVQRRDLPLVEALVFVIAVIVVLINLFVDLFYARLNPKIRYSGGS